MAEVLLAFRGGKGCGKGIIASAFGKMFGSHFKVVYQQNHLTGKFNAHLRDCLFLIVNEAFWAGMKQEAATLKQLITERTMQVEPKGFETEQVPNYMSILMTTNEDWFAPASADERRFAAFDCDNKYIGNRPYFEALAAELANGGIAAMLHDLRTRELEHGWHPGMAYRRLRRSIARSA
jgi:predicted P-loop ATPase